MLIWLLTTAWAGCEEPVQTQTVFDAIDRAHTAFGALDLEGFEVVVAEVRSGVPCLAEPATRHMAAEVHRLEALAAFVDRDEGRTHQAFAAARALEPSFRYDEGLFPDGHPIYGAYTALDPVPDATRAVPPPREGRLRFDGAESTDRPLELPTLTQWVVADEVRVSGYRWPSDPMPKYPKAGDRRIPWFVASGASLVVSGTLYGLAAQRNAAFDRETDLDRLPALRSQANGFVVGATVTGVGAVGLGVGGILVGR